VEVGCCGGCVNNVVVTFTCVRPAFNSAMDSSLKVGVAYGSIPVPSGDVVMQYLTSVMTALHIIKIINYLLMLICIFSIFEF